MLEIEVEGKKVWGMLDMGADCSVVNAEQWSDAWPIQNSLTPVAGIGGSQGAQKAAKFLNWTYQDLTGLFKPLRVGGLGYALWGRDVLSQMGVHLTTPEHLYPNS